eukprot:4360112-Heterocapsa_arctica.AAC.1
MSTFIRPPPPGYAKPSLQQIRKADEVVFALSAKFSKDGIKRKGGKRPFDDLVDKGLCHREYTL